MIRRIFPIVVVVVFLLGLIFLFIPLLLQRSQSESKNSSHILGSKDARVYIIGYFDLESSQSREAWEKVAYLRDQYGDRVSFEFRHYPITAIHSRAMTAAMALEAAGEQEKFWEFLDILWSQQDTWRAVSDSKTLFTQYSTQAGIKDREEFLDAMEQQQLTARIFTDLRDAHAQGVSWETPFLVNGEPSQVDVIQLAVERVISKPR